MSIMMGQLLVTIALCLIINCSLSIAGKSYFSVFLHHKFLVQPMHILCKCFQLAHNCQFDIKDVCFGNITYPESQYNTLTKKSWKHLPDADAGMSLKADWQPCPGSETWGWDFSKNKIRILRVWNIRIFEYLRILFYTVFQKPTFCVMVVRFRQCWRQYFEL